MASTSRSAQLLALSALAALAALAGCSSSPRRQPASAPASRPASRPSSKALDQRIAAVIAKARAAGWRVTATIRVPGAQAALITYKGRRAGDPPPSVFVGSQRLDAMALAGDVVTAMATEVEVHRAPGGKLLWDLRGDGGAQVVLGLTECGANCSDPSFQVLELAGGRWARAKKKPECPTCIHDHDRDQVPEFDATLLVLPIADCTRACGNSYMLEVSVNGLESWDGAKYSRELARLVPLYRAKLRAARAAASKARAARAKKGICPLKALEAAAAVAVYRRLLGAPWTAALAEADAVMKGHTTAPCRKRYGVTSAPKPWSELRTLIAQARLPRLPRVAKKTK